METTVLIIPGIHNSGPDHWQSLWQAAHPSYRRIEVDDWDHPDCAAWQKHIAKAIEAAPGPVLLAAHSLGCLALLEWVRGGSVPGKVRGALLVALPDPQGPNFPLEATGFVAPDLAGLPFPAFVVASDNDPYSDPAYSKRCADGLGARLVIIGNAGHINAASGLGAWEAGHRLLLTL